MTESRYVLYSSKSLDPSPDLEKRHVNYSCTVTVELSNITVKHNFFEKKFWEPPAAH